MQPLLIDDCHASKEDRVRHARILSSCLIVISFGCGCLSHPLTLQAETAALRFRINSVHSESHRRVFQFDGSSLRVVEGTTVDIAANDRIFPRVNFAFEATIDPDTRQFDGTFSYSTADGDLLLAGRFDDAALRTRTGLGGKQGMVFFRRNDLND